MFIITWTRAPSRGYRGHVTAPTCRHAFSVCSPSVSTETNGVCLSRHFELNKVCLFLHYRSSKRIHCIRSLAARSALSTRRLPSPVPVVLNMQFYVSSWSVLKAPPSLILHFTACIHPIGGFITSSLVVGSCGQCFSSCWRSDGASQRSRQKISL